MDITAMGVGLSEAQTPECRSHNDFLTDKHAPLLARHLPLLNRQNFILVFKKVESLTLMCKRSD